MPSTESVRSLASAPALLTSTSRRAVSSPSRSANRRTDSQVAEVAEADLDVAVGRPCRDLRAGALAALLAAGEQPDGGAEAREALGGGEAEPRGRTGDEHDLPVHRRLLGGAPHASAHAIADARVARDDGAVEDRVEQ